jgi:hypothetical protein
VSGAPLPNKTGHSGGSCAGAHDKPFQNVAPADNPDFLIVVRRQVHEMEAARGQKAETLQDRIEVNKLDITLPADSLHTADRKQAKGWKGREQKTAGQKAQKRPKGYRLSRDDR